MKSTSKESSRRRICILASMGWGVRNVLMSKAMSVLQPQCDIHVFSTFNHVEAFRERFASIGSLESIIDLDMHKLTRVLYNWNILAFYKISPSATHQYKVSKRMKKHFGKEKGNPKNQKALPTAPDQAEGPPENGHISLGRLLSALSPGRLQSRALRKTDLLLQKLTLKYGNTHIFRASRRLLAESFRHGNRYKIYKQYFKEHSIDTVVTSNPLVPIEYPALIAARDMGLRTVAVITSWDNLTSKRPLIIDFDEYMVWNPIMAREVQFFYDIPPERVCEIGPLQFDYYSDERFFETREEFCRRFGFDPSRQIVVYSTVTKLLLRDEPAIIAKLLGAMKDGRVAGSPNLLVRTHPKRPLEEFRPVMDDPRWKGLRVAWAEAGKSVAKLDLWCPMDNELRLLTNTVRHGDVNLNCFSTMLLDFAVLGKPAVLICHDSQDRKLHYEVYEHLKPVLACKGNRIGYTFEQTLAHLNAYLESPELDAQGRRAMVEMQCGRYLGSAWQRLANAILQTSQPGGTPAATYQLETGPVPG